MQDTTEPAQAAAALPEFSRPYPWAGIDAACLKPGGAILRGLFSAATISALSDDIDRYLQQHTGAALPHTGSAAYDQFLGLRTLRLHGLLEKFPGAAGLIDHDDLVAWAGRLLAPRAGSILLNAGEYIQINPGESRQAIHRDTDSWPIALDGEPLAVNAIIALDDFTADNGATAIAPDSWHWPPDRRATGAEFTRALMQRGDAVLFRGDLLHGGGDNRSAAPRRAVSLSYCAGWLRPVENSFLNLSPATVAGLRPRLQELLGYHAHDGRKHNAGYVGLYENGDPRDYLRALAPDR